MDDGKIRAEDRAREENLQIFNALNGLKRHGLRTDDVEAVEAPSKERSWRRTWGSLVTQYGKRDEARLHVAIRPFTHMQCSDASQREMLLERVTESLKRVGVFPLKGFSDVFDVVGSTDSDGTRRIQIFFDDTGIQEYVMLS